MIFSSPEPGLPFEPSPAATRGMVAHNLETGVSRCHRVGCGWRGAPTLVGGQVVHECPRCDVGPAFDHEYAHTVLYRPLVVARSKISRNAPCPCGSGRKAKKCCL